MSDYQPRVVDRELDELCAGLAAIAIEGPKGVGKTATAARRAETMVALDDPVQRELVSVDPGRLDRSPGPVLIDEWQRLPMVWDVVRRSVDRDARPGRFLLTGSANPTEAPVHSGAGRIVQLRMRPMSLAERGLEPASVSLSGLLSGERIVVSGQSRCTPAIYAEEIVRSGFPGVRGLPAKALRAQLDGYLARIAEHDFQELGMVVRRPATLRAWLAAYAAATATTTSYNAILDAATPGDANKPAKTTTIAYRDILSRLWLLDPVPGWLPVGNAFTRLAQAPKHHLADPGLAARLLGIGAESLLSGTSADTRLPARGNAFGQLFESLVAQSLQVYAQVAEARVHHLRTRNGDHEIDFVIERADGGVVAIEVKLSPTVSDRDVTHLKWLKEHIGDRLLDAAIITTGPEAYRREDGVAVVPAGLLGP